MCELILKKSLRRSSATTALLKVRPLALAFWVVAFGRTCSKFQSHTGTRDHNGTNYSITI